MENYRFVKKLNQLLADNGCTLMIYAINCDMYWNEDNMRAETGIFELIDFDRTDILIIMHERIKSRTITEKLAARAKEKGIPVILTDGKLEGCTSISFDYGAGFEKCVRHVVEYHGMKDVHLIAGIKGNPFSDERIEVFRKVLAENGIEYNDSMMSYGNFWAVPAKEAAEKVIASGHIPQCFICANDIMAINVAAVLRDHGYVIPDDVAVTGFDGIDEVYFSIPRITTCRCGASEFAEPVFRVCMDYLRNGAEPEDIRICPTLLINPSCGCEESMPADDYLISNFNDRFYRSQDDAQSLSETSERMLACRDIVSAACCLYGSAFHDTAIMINKSCFDSTRNYFEIQRIQPFDDEIIHFFDTNSPVVDLKPMDRREILPDIDNEVSGGYPMIFAAITFMNTMLGYACFRYRNYELIDYCKISQVVSSIGSGLGGYITMQYQNHLSRQIEEMYKYDSLTGLYNRLGFSKDYAERLASVTGKKLPMTVLLADIDNLKYINDNFGHYAGDNAIHIVAKALRASCPEDALCLRFGGDEMLAVIIGECSGKKIRAEIDKYLAEYNADSGLSYEVACSVGIFLTDTVSDTDLEHLIRQTDKEMYKEKFIKHGERRKAKDT